jgi:cardiolipin synthase A/B
MLELLREFRPVIVGFLSILLSIVVSAHVVLNKRDIRTAAGWIGVVCFLPVVGSVLYALFGVNRIRRRGQTLRRLGMDLRPPPRDSQTDWKIVSNVLPAPQGYLAGIARVVSRVTRRPLVTGNQLTPLKNGDEAYPDMLEMIDGATRSIALSTFIFDNDEVGRSFTDALGRAVSRGLEVRVLIDAVGSRYSWPPIMRELRRNGIRYARFMQTVAPWRMPFLNLRNHRKILVVDGELGYTGGMNIREGHVMSAGPKRPVQDLQFRVEGPVAGHLMDVFAEDWAFSTKEVLDGDAWFPELTDAGPILARGISDGPGEDFDKARITMLGALATAQKEITIVTPYFLPDMELISALTVAAMRGVNVRILLPQVNNQLLVKWASTALLWQLLQRGCRVFLTAPPFDHTKLMLVDGAWTLVGSANWDPRSLRLNFEFNIECYDEGLCEDMARLVEEKLNTASEVTKAQVDGRSIPIQLRDGLARLLSPYL